MIRVICDHIWKQITKWHVIWSPSFPYEVRKLFVSACMSPASLTLILNITTVTVINLQLQKLRGWLPIKFGTLASVCVYVRVYDACVCVYDSFWLTAVPLGAQPGQCRRVYVWVCVWERVKRVCTCLYACVHISIHTCVCVCLFVPWSCPDLNTLLWWLKTITASNTEHFFLFWTVQVHVPLSILLCSPSF